MFCLVNQAPQIGKRCIRVLHLKFIPTLLLVLPLLSHAQSGGYGSEVAEVIHQSDSSRSKMAACALLLKGKNTNSLRGHKDVGAIAPEVAQKYLEISSQIKPSQKTADTIGMEFLHALNSQSSQAKELFLQRHSDLILMHIKRYLHHLKDPDDVLDLHQQTYLLYWNLMKSVKPRSSFTGGNALVYLSFMSLNVEYRLAEYVLNQYSLVTSRHSILTNPDGKRLISRMIDPIFAEDVDGYQEQIRVEPDEFLEEKLFVNPLIKDESFMNKVEAAIAQKYGDYPVFMAIYRERVMSDNPKTLEELARQFGKNKERIRLLESKLMHFIRTLIYRKFKEYHRV